MACEAWRAECGMQRVACGARRAACDVWRVREGRGHVLFRSEGRQALVPSCSSNAPHPRHLLAFRTCLAHPSIVPLLLTLRSSCGKSPPGPKVGPQSNACRWRWYSRGSCAGMRLSWLSVLGLLAVLGSVPEAAVPEAAAGAAALFWRLPFALLDIISCQCRAAPAPRAHAPKGAAAGFDALISYSKQV